jgi:hypothetical protein
LCTLCSWVSVGVIEFTSASRTPKPVFMRGVGEVVQFWVILMAVGIAVMRTGWTEAQDVASSRLGVSVRRSCGYTESSKDFQFLLCSSVATCVKYKCWTMGLPWQPGSYRSVSFSFLIPCFSFPWQPSHCARDFGSARASQSTRLCVLAPSLHASWLAA